MKTQRHVNGNTGSHKGNPEPSARRHHQQRRPSPNHETGARSRGSVRSDRCNKFWSPGTNAPPAARASRHAPETCATTISTSPSRSAGARRKGRTLGTTAKGQINGRGFGRRRAPIAAGPRLRHQDVQNYPMDGGKAQKISRRPGRRTGDAGSDRTRKVDRLTSRRKAAVSARTNIQKTKHPP